VIRTKRNKPYRAPAGKRTNERTTTEGEHTEPKQNKTNERPYTGKHATREKRVIDGATAATTTTIFGHFVYIHWKAIHTVDGMTMRSFHLHLHKNIVSFHGQCNTMQYISYRAEPSRRHASRVGHRGWLLKGREARDELTGIQID